MDVDKVLKSKKESLDQKSHLNILLGMMIMMLLDLDI